jgi:uncharacterized cupredoxin-like copper-binding protein
MQTPRERNIIPLATFNFMFNPEDNKMTLSRLAIYAATVFTLAAPALADSVVSVTLRDTGVTTDLSKSMGLGMAMKGDMKTAIMSIDINPKSVLQGKVKFNVKNSSATVIHEMILAPLKDSNVPLPYLDKDNKVDEEAAVHLGEVSELDPGKSGSLTVDMKPGKYVLYCNIVGHYMAGMWTIIDVR